MKRCLELAKNGLGTTYPNPLVGCVIVHKDKIIGEGWHQIAGGPHAEVHALNSVKEPEKLKDATLYVSLEPCSHYGKTPPCSDLIIAKGIKKVVIGAVDPNPKVAGKGVMKLTQFCDEVYVGLLEKECEQLNKRFFKGQREKRPYVILKWAQTADGFIAPPEQEFGKPFWITNPYSKQLVHKWRSEEQAILIGQKTAIKDNPQLNTRLWKGPNPVRVLIDPQLKTLKSKEPLHLFDGMVKTIVFGEKKPENRKNVVFETLDFEKVPLLQLLQKLYAQDLQSVIIEGGAYTLQAFIDADLWDEARVFTGPTNLGDGIKAPHLHVKNWQSQSLQNDTLKIAYHD